MMDQFTKQIAWWSVAAGSILVAVFGDHKSLVGAVVVWGLFAVVQAIECGKKRSE